MQEESKIAKPRVAVIGATGTIGAAVVKELANDYDVILAGRSCEGKGKVDITSAESIATFYKANDGLDAVICCGGSAYWGPMERAGRDELQVGWASKAGGQIDLVLQGHKALNVGGAFILTTGFLDRTPLRGATLITAVNSAVNGFVRAAPIELAEGRRILAVSPGFIAESKYPESIRGGLPEIAVENVAKVYRRALVSGMTGKVLTITASTYIED